MAADRAGFVPEAVDLTDAQAISDLFDRLAGIDGEALPRALLAPPWRTFVLPGSAYGLPDHIRLGVGGGPETRLDEGLDHLSRFLRTGDG